jgi:hypothetical protein
LRHKEKERKNMEMMEMQSGNPIPERGDGRRKAGLHTMGAKGEGAQYLSMENKFR